MHVVSCCWTALKKYFMTHGGNVMSNLSAMPQRTWWISVFYGLIKVYFPKSCARKPGNTFPHQSMQRAQQSRWHMSALQHSIKKWRNRWDQDRRSAVSLTQQSGSANLGHSNQLSGASHPSSQSIHRRPTVILFVQINKEVAAAPHGGTQRVVIAAFQAGSDGLCGRPARLHYDLVYVCNFPQA